jgi:hypothetical protein
MFSVSIFIGTPPYKKSDYIILTKFALSTGMSEFSVNIHLFNVNNQRIRPQKEYSSFLKAQKDLLGESKGGPDGLNIHFSMDFDAQNTHFSIEKRC